MIIVILFVLKRSVAYPLGHLTQVIGDFKIGNDQWLDNMDRFSKKVDQISTNSNETGLLARSFVEMADHLRTTYFELEKSEDRFRGIVESMSDWIWEVDSDGRYKYCSKKVESILGYTSGEMIGKTPFDFMKPDEAERIKGQMVKIIAKKASIKDLENWNICKDGRHICLLTNGVPILNKSGDLLGYQGVDRDITESKIANIALRESDEKHRKLISNISDVIVILDKEGIITYKSSNITKQFGWSPDELIGKHGLFTAHPDDQKRVGELLTKVLKQDSAIVQIEYNYFCKDGSYKPVELIAVNMVNDPVIKGILANYKDITQRRQANEKLYKSEEKHRIKCK